MTTLTPRFIPRRAVQLDATGACYEDVAALIAPSELHQYIVTKKTNAILIRTRDSLTTANVGDFLVAGEDNAVALIPEAVAKKLFYTERQARRKSITDALLIGSAILTATAFICKFIEGLAQ